jgi:thioredoxin reductase
VEKIVTGIADVDNVDHVDGVDHEDPVDGVGGAADATYDVVVAGGGVAALSAALVLSRARRRVLVIDEGKPRNAPAAHIEGMLSRDGLAPSELLRLGRAEAREYGSDIVNGVVEKARRHAATPTPGFAVTLDSGEIVECRRLLIATGLTDHLPYVPGLRRRWGRDAYSSVHSHGWEVRGAPVAVLRTGDASIQQALLLTRYASDVVYFPNDAAMPTESDMAKLAAFGVRVVPGVVRRLVVEHDQLTGVAFTPAETGGVGDAPADLACEGASGTREHVVPRSAVFVVPRTVPNDGLLRMLGCEFDDIGWVVADPTGRTSVAGMWAAGNVVDPDAQVVSAASAGSKAAIAIDTDILAEDVELALGSPAGVTV